MLTPLAFIGVVHELAKLSKDPSTKVACLIFGPNMEIRSTGWNGFPRKVSDTPERLNDRQVKYSLVAHAELNAVANAARSGVSTDGCELLVSALHPCNECAKAIIQAGIRKVYAPLPDNDGRWATNFEIAALLFSEAGVEVEFY
jgi:dCMP deaminase